MDAQLTASYSPSLRLTLTSAAFACALFTSAALLFWVQPLVAKMLLPMLGGAPAVWNTCMIFFQALLLAGYAYALFLSQRLTLRKQAILHISVLIAAGFFLPFAFSARMLASLPTHNNPTPWLLGVLLLTVGPPFFVLSATAPLLQKWFSYSDDRLARDPYFLYAISNAGSLLSLLAFPFVLEPRLALRSQSVGWAFGYLLLAALIICCAMVLKERSSIRVQPMSLVAAGDGITKSRRLFWVALSFIPSSLMLGVTTHISTDVASMPLIWIVPLALYLSTFMLAFAARQVIRLKTASLVLPAVIIALGSIIALKPQIPVALLLALHLLVFFLAAFICHRQLALNRPAVTRLPEYYLWIALGGVLGGVFNALLAPFLFSTPLEYPLVIIAACMMRPAAKPWNTSGRLLRLAFPSFIFLTAVGLSHLIPRFNLSQPVQDGVVLCIPLALCYLFAARQPIAFALTLLSVMAGGYRYLNANEDVLALERNFFGIWRVSSDKNEPYHRLKHGSTIHGGQFTDNARRCNATSYYHKAGPLGQVVDVYKAKPGSGYVGAAGLGAGTVVTYSSPEQQWDFYEIDPAIVRLASDRRFFTFLNGCAAGPYRVVLGDVRLRLREAPEHHYGLFILDAFSSDSIPAHLLTRQALDLYLSKLARDGLLAFHISNRYLNLEPLLSGLSQESGLSALIRVDNEIDLAEGKHASVWVVMARTEASLGKITTDSRWRRLRGNAIWTDDFSNILDLLK